VSSAFVFGYRRALAGLCVSRFRRGDRARVWEPACNNRAFNGDSVRTLIMLELDHFDLALLDVLQRFGRATHQQLAEQVPLSPSQIGRRLQRLEQLGVVDGYRVVLRPEKLGLGVTAFTSLKLKHHGDSVIEQFQQQIEVLPEVLECHAVVGDADYLLRIVAPDLNYLSTFVMKKLMRVPGVDSVRSNIVLTTFKRNGPLPLGHLSPGAAAA